MNTLKNLAKIAAFEGLTIEYKPLELYDAITKDNKIIISEHVRRSEKEAVILSHELAHHFTHRGNILDKPDPDKEKQADDLGELLIRFCALDAELLPAAVKALAALC